MRKNWKVILTVVLVIVVVLVFSLGAMSLASDGYEKIDSGAATTHTKGWVTVVISVDSAGKTYVSYVAVNAPEGCIVTSIKIVVKGGTEENSYTRNGSSASGMFYAPMNNGGQRADVSHVEVYYWYYCPTPTPDPGTPNPGTPDPGTPNPGTPDPGTPNPGTPDPGTPDPGTPDPGTPTPNNSTPTPKPSEPPIPGRG